MYGKIVIRFKMKVLTGMHIGGSSVFSAIGAVGSVVIRDALTGEPMLPGSSIKGKMRTLLVKKIENDYLLPEISDDPEEIKRLFGSTVEKDKKEYSKSARLQFSDAFLINGEFLKKKGGITEIKFENVIDRLTAKANPRQIERVVRGAEFAITLAYTMEKGDEIKEDFENIAEALKLVSMDYLGGHGSRGYGKVAFYDFALEVKDGQCPVDAVELLDILKGVEGYAVFSV
jgi:CRISPR-associated protein Csm3